MGEIEELARRVVDAMIAVEGDHPGFRVAHPKGILCSGSFTAGPAAPGLTRAAHMQGDPVRAHVRFSNGAGGPEGRDGGRVGRGMAVKLYLPDGSTTDIVALRLEAFFVRTPEDFLAFLEARRPDPETGDPDLARVGEFLSEHPEAGAVVQAALSEPIPASFATCAYHGIHAFRLVNSDGEGSWARYHWEPDAGIAAISDEDAKEKSRDFLQEELAERLAEGAAGFQLVAQLADEGDPIDDPTQQWPAERERVELGRLEVTEIARDREKEGDVLVFDPTRVTDGIECSEDRILNFRTHAYSVSVERRTGVGREAMPPVGGG